MSKIKTFDIETNGLLETVDKFHCGVIHDSVTGEYRRYRPHQAPAFLADLADADLIVGHNILGYDLPVLKKLFGWEVPKGVEVHDTIVMARYLAGDVKDADFAAIKKGTYPKGRQAGSHALEAWGYRLGEMKGEYPDIYKARVEAEGGSYKKGDEWAAFNEDMLEYNVQDVVVTVKLYAHLLAGGRSSPLSMFVEHRTQELILQQTAFGFTFDIVKARSLYAALQKRRLELERECNVLFDPWVVGKPAKVAGTSSAQFGYVKGVEFTPVEVIAFNPGSRAHIANRLQKLYGWAPTERTPTGEVKVDEDVLNKLPYPPCRLLTEFMLVQKRIGQIAEGSQSWFHRYNEDTGCIHGSVNTCGAITGRMTHSNPNVAQVPAVRKNKQGILYGGAGGYGAECRELWGPPKGWLQVGTDTSGLELRMLGHYMARFDGGRYGMEVVNGDIHTLNQIAAGLPSRDNAKTFIYAFLYGAGDGKIGAIVGKSSAAGRELKGKFLKKVPALQQLITAIDRAVFGYKDQTTGKTVKGTGTLRGLDGRVVPVRHRHAALNTLLQGAGAVVCKLWMIRIHDFMAEHGWDHGNDYRQMANIHDECQFAARTQEIAEAIVFASEWAIKRVEEELKIRTPLAVESKIGINWMECH